MTDLAVDDDLFDTDLHIASRLGDIEDVKQALKKGYHPDTIGLYKWNSLHEASLNGDISIVKLLLKHGANPNTPDLLSSSSALHYACADSHYECVHALLEAGADGNLLNSKKESPCDLARDSKCKEILLQHGYVAKKKAIKSILKSSNLEAKKSNKSSNDIPKSIQSNASADTRPLKVVIENRIVSNDMDDLPSPTSVDSGRFSAIHRTPTKLNWETSSDGLLQLPASPARSIGSSYGSLTSLGSSGCSAADDCAGHFVLSFQYNSKTEEFKIRLWEIGLISLLPVSKMPKDTSICLYVQSNLITEGEYKANPSLKKKSEVFRLHLGEHAESQCLTKSIWNEREACLEFRSSISLEYAEISKYLVDSSSVKISLCIQRKRSLLSSKKSVHHDPVLASVEMEMKSAVKRLKKESYDTERYDVLGITRQAIPLDGVIADSAAFDNRSFISDPTVSVPVSPLANATNPIARSSSVGNLNAVSVKQSRSTVKPFKQSRDVSTVDLTRKEERDSGYGKSEKCSSSSLGSVVSHLPSDNPEISIRIPSEKSDILTSVVVGSNTSCDNSDVKVNLPHTHKSAYHDNKKKQRDKSKHVGHNSKSKLKSAKRSLLSSASSAIRPNITPVTSLDDEERSMGSPSEEISYSREDSHRSTRPSSLIEVDESPSRAHNIRPKPFLSSPQPAYQRKGPGQTPVKPQHFTLTMEPHKSDYDIEVGPVCDRSNASMSPLILKEKSEVKDKKSRGTTSFSSSRLHATRTAGTTQSRRNSVLRKLVFDDASTEDAVPVDNPCYVNDQC